MTDFANTEGADLSEEDPRTQLWESIAQGISTLSEATDTPSGVSPASSFISRDEVDMTSDTWMPQLAEVQGWLNLAEQLPSSDRDAFHNSLISSLELDPDAALGTTTLTEFVPTSVVTW